MKLDTICVQGTYKPKNGEPRVIPIIQSTTYKYDSSVEMGNLFDLKESGYFYSRLQNPTCDNVASKICALEGGVAGMLTGSGQAANFYAVFNIAQAGDHIVSSSAIYGGTISNPSLDILDIETFASVAHKNGIPLIVDNTFATPINCRVFDYGVDIVTHSTTKYMEGHASTIGGAIVDSGNFDWTQNDKFPGLTTPDDSYHGIVYTEAFGNGAYITKATVQLMRDLGSVQSPNDAFLLNVGLESLHLRVQRHCENAKAVAQYLEKHPKISWVNCAMLESDSQYEIAKKYMPNGTCGVVSFGIKGGREAATKFMDSLQLAAIVTHVADTRTCCLHPASTTHRQLTDEQLKECGVSPDLVRFSCGIEAAEDIIADIEQALEKVD